MRWLSLAVLILLILPALAVSFEVNDALVKGTITSENDVVGTVVVSNTGDRQDTFMLTSYPEGLKFSDVEFVLNAGESREVDVSIDHPARINTFEVLIKSGKQEQTLPVVAEWEDENIIFDSTVKVNKSSKDIRAGEKISAVINTFTSKDVGTQEINMEYSIYNQRNEKVSSNNKKILVGERHLESVNIDTPTFLTKGRYVLAVTLNYNSQYSTSTDSFSITEPPEEPSLFFNPILIMITTIGLLVIIFLILLTHRHIKKLEMAHWSHAFEFRKHRLYLHRNLLRNRLQKIKKQLESGKISKETHRAHHTYITKKIKEITKLLGER